MATRAAGSAVKLIDTLRARWTDEPDERLLASYARDRDPEALAALVARHGPAVWAVCRRLLRCPHDAEDAFQTTFLTLVRSASAINGPLGGWLYRVAVRTTAKLRAAAHLRASKERSAEAREPTEGHTASAERDAIVAREVGQLPPIYRDVVVVCDLQGMPRAKAARTLGCPEGTVAGRLARAREMLARRFTRLGLQPGAVVLITGMTAATSAGVPPRLLQSTLAAVSAVPTGGSIPVLVGWAVSRRLWLRVTAAVGVATAAGFVVGIPTGRSGGPPHSAAETAALVQADSRSSPDLISPPLAHTGAAEPNKVNIGFAVATGIGDGNSPGEPKSTTVTVTRVAVLNPNP